MYSNEIYKNIVVVYFAWWPAELWAYSSAKIDEVKISLLKAGFSDFYS